VAAETYAQFCERLTAAYGAHLRGFLERMLRDERLERVVERDVYRILHAVRQRHDCLVSRALVLDLAVERVRVRMVRRDCEELCGIDEAELRRVAERASQLEVQRIASSAALETLAPDLRRLVRMRWMQGLPIQQIARQLKAHPRVIELELLRALRLWREASTALEPLLSRAATSSTPQRPDPGA
jgi:DNA-directed RNA polymerase specialized sigma24 family protein